MAGVTLPQLARGVRKWPLLWLTTNAGVVMIPGSPLSTHSQEGSSLHNHRSTRSSLLHKRAHRWAAQEGSLHTHRRTRGLVAAQEARRRGKRKRARRRARSKIVRRCTSWRDPRWAPKDSSLHQIARRRTDSLLHQWAHRYIRGIVIAPEGGSLSHQQPKVRQEGSSLRSGRGLVAAQEDISAAVLEDLLLGSTRGLVAAQEDSSAAALEESSLGSTRELVAAQEDSLAAALEDSSLGSTRGIVASCTRGRIDTKEASSLGRTRGLVAAPEGSSPEHSSSPHASELVADPERLSPSVHQGARRSKSVGWSTHQKRVHRRSRGRGDRH